MTQFLALTGPKPDISEIEGGWVISFEEAFPLVQETLRKHIQEDQFARTWMLRGGDTGEPADKMCGDLGYEMVVKQKPFEDATLGKFLTRYLDGGFEQITLFYAAGDAQLKCFDDQKKFFEYIQDPEQLEYNAILKN